MKKESPIVGMIAKLEKKKKKFLLKIKECDNAILELLNAHQVAQVERLKTMSNFDGE
jgi:hypothetical protein